MVRKFYIPDGAEEDGNGEMDEEVKICVRYVNWFVFSFKEIKSTL